MRTIVLYIAASLDTCIARKDGRVDWLPDGGGDYGYDALYQRIDTTLMGYNTYREVLGYGIPFPYPDKTNYVFSRTERPKDKNPVTFVSSDPVAFVRRLQEQPGGDIWLVGGGQLNTLLLDADLIDELIITLIPIVLGDGIPLFAGRPGETKLQLKGHRAYESGLVQLTYARSRP